MIISCLYPQKIYIEDEKIKDQVENIFGKKFNVKIGEWFDCSIVKNNDNNGDYNYQNSMLSTNKNNNKFLKNNKNNTVFNNFCVNNNTKMFNFDFDIEKKGNEMFNNNFECINKKTTYIVKPTDTYQSVSVKLGVSIEALKSIAKTKYLFVGQKIDIQNG